MAKTVPLDAGTLAWARGVFGRYYARERIDPPSRLVRREFAAFPFATETMMRRHATLRSPEEFRAYLAREVPRHVYYSSAYYRRPAEPTMAAKEWLGADLIFDLDSDHLRGAEELDYAGQLRLVKARLIDLVDDFLFRDFGIDPASTAFVFSGGRGYHVHVQDDRFLSLTSPERRELVDYVLGVGVDPIRVIEPRREDVRSGRVAAVIDDAEGAAPTRRSSPLVRSLAPPESPGWTGRSTRALLRVLARWEVKGSATAREEMIGFGMPPAEARRWARLLVELHGASRIQGSLSLDALKGQQLPEKILSAVVEGAKVEVQGETDAPVTTDIHRLIRLPRSLHGGTGFRVVPLARDEIDGFDPFREAVMGDPDGDRTPITYLDEVEYPFPGGGLHGSAGKTDELPTPMALFLVLRGEAELRLSPG